MEGGAKPSGAKLNRLRAQWEQGKCTVGAIATIPSVQAVQVMGFDWSLLQRGITSAIADIKTDLD